jgi:hypothetical protein
LGRYLASCLHPLSSRHLPARSPALSSVPYLLLQLPPPSVPSLCALQSEPFLSLLSRVCPHCRSCICIFRYAARPCSRASPPLEKSFPLPEALISPHSVHTLFRPAAVSLVPAIEPPANKPAVGPFCSRSLSFSTASRFTHIALAPAAPSSPPSHGLLQRPQLVLAGARPPVVVGTAPAALALRYRPQWVQRRRTPE